MNPKNAAKIVLVINPKNVKLEIVYEINVVNIPMINTLNTSFMG
jgi:hypothetical protein